MSKIKTYEEYVLNSLEELQKDYDKALKLNEQQFYEINKLKSQLEDSCREIKKYKDVLKIIAKYCVARDENINALEKVGVEDRDKIEILYMFLSKESWKDKPNKDFVVIIDTLIPLISELEEEEAHD